MMFWGEQMLSRVFKEDRGFLPVGIHPLIGHQLRNRVTGIFSEASPPL